MLSDTSDGMCDLHCAAFKVGWAEARMRMVAQKNHSTNMRSEHLQTVTKLRAIYRGKSAALNLQDNEAERVTIRTHLAGGAAFDLFAEKTPD